MSILKKIKENYGYFKKGLEVERQNYARLQRIKGTPDNYLSDEDREWAKKMNKIPSYKRGGKVKKTGLAKLHKGERVLTKKQARLYKKKKK